MDPLSTRMMQLQTEYKLKRVNHAETACWRASYTSASILASSLSSSDPLPAATFCASARLALMACKYDDERPCMRGDAWG